MAASTDRAAVAPPEKNIGIVPRYVCVSWSMAWVSQNRATAPAVMRAGTNQNLAPSFPHRVPGCPPGGFPRPLPLRTMATVEHSS